MFFLCSLLNRMDKIPEILNEVRTDFAARLPILDPAFLFALKDKKVLTGAERNTLDRMQDAMDKRCYLLDTLAGKQTMDPYMAFRKILQEKASGLFKKLEDAEKEFKFGEPGTDRADYCFRLPSHAPGGGGSHFDMLYVLCDCLLGRFFAKYGIAIGGFHQRRRSSNYINLVYFGQIN